MVISGGAGTLLGPIVGAALVVIIKNVVSAYVVRWNFMLGAIFVAIVVFMPEGLVPGMVRLSRSAWRAMSGAKPTRVRRSRSQSHDRARRQQFEQIVRRLARHRQRQSHGRAGRAPADHRPERRRQDHACSISSPASCAPDCRLDPCCSAATSPRVREPQARPSRHGAHLSDHHAVHRATRSCATSRWRCSGCRRCAGIRCAALHRQHASGRPGARRARARRPRPHRRPAAGGDLLWRKTPRRDRHGAGAKSEGAAARRAVRRPVDRRAPRRAATAQPRSRATSPS